MLKVACVAFLSLSLIACGGMKSVKEFREENPLVYEKTIPLEISIVHENVAGMFRKCLGTKHVQADFYGSRSTILIGPDFWTVGLVELKKIDDETTRLTAPVPTESRLKAADRNIGRWADGSLRECVM